LNETKVDLINSSTEQEAFQHRILPYPYPFSVRLLTPMNVSRLYGDECPASRTLC